LIVTVDSLASQVLRTIDDEIMSTRPENPMTITTASPARPQSGPPQTASAEIPEVPLTTEGYSVLHQMMRFRWTAWRALPEDTRTEIAREATAVLCEMEQRSEGQSALFSLIGHKGDLMLVHFRNSFADLNQAELKLAGLRLSDYLEPTSSYLSIIELGLYDSTLKIYKELTAQGHSAAFRPVEGGDRMQAQPAS
jgi:hypothetical protein